MNLLGRGAQRPVLTSATPADQDWYGNLVWIERRKCLLLAHVGTLFSVFEPEITKAGLTPIGACVVALINRELKAEGLPLDTFGPLSAETVQIARTADRSVLGCMNEMAFASRLEVQSRGGLSRVDVTDLNRRLRRDIHLPTGYRRPIDLATTLAGADQSRDVRSRLLAT